MITYRMTRGELAAMGIDATKDTTTGAVSYVERSWDGKRRLTARAYGPSKNNPDGSVSYLERYASIAAIRAAVEAAPVGATRHPVDYL